VQQVITTVEELDELPEGAVVVIEETYSDGDVNREAAIKSFDQKWCLTILEDYGQCYDAQYVLRPWGTWDDSTVRVLLAYRPDRPA
jgi:hypothetical protein